MPSNQTVKIFSSILPNCSDLLKYVELFVGLGKICIFAKISIVETH